MSFQRFTSSVTGFVSVKFLNARGKYFLQPCGTNKLDLN